METVEAYCAAHNESADTVLYEWSATKFEALNSAFQKRILADALDQKRSLEIASMYANGGFEDSDKLEQAITSIATSYGKSIAAIYGKITKDELEQAIGTAKEFDIDEDDPFFRSGSES